MSGTNTSPDKVARDRPSPFVAELKERQRGIVHDGAEPWNETVEQRREVRRRDLFILRTVSVESGVRLNEAMAGRIAEWDCPLFKQLADPVSALAKLNRSVIQIVLAEEQLDETGEERAARIAAEAEARVKAEYAAVARRDYTASQLRRAENRRVVQHAVSEITLAELRMGFGDRDRMLTRLFAELDKDESRFALDPAEVIADVTSRLGLTPAATLSPADKDRLAERRKQRVAAARDHLEALRMPDPDEDDADPDAFPACAPHGHGPPN